MKWIIIGLVVLIAIAAWVLRRRGQAGVNSHGSTDTDTAAIARSVDIQRNNWGGGA